MLRNNKLYAKKPETAPFYKKKQKIKFFLKKGLTSADTYDIINIVVREDLKKSR